MRFPSLGAAVVAALSIYGTSTALAQDIVLTSRDGEIELEGQLRGYDGEFYRISSKYGLLTVDSQGVTCAGPACPELDHYVARVRIAGSDKIGSVLFPALLEQFARARGYGLQRTHRSDQEFDIAFLDQADGRLVAQFRFDLGTSDRAFAAMIADDADLGLSLREPNQAELAAALANGIGDLSDGRRARVLALDALVPVVAPDSPLRELDASALAGILSGKTTTWGEVAPALSPLGSVALVTASREQDEDHRVLTQWAGANAERAFLKPAQRSLPDEVARDASAIGFARLSDIGSTRVLSMRGSCGLKIEAAANAIRSEDYPLTMPLMIYTPARRLPLVAREFLAWIDTPTAHRAIRQAGFIDQAVREVAIGAQGDRLRAAILNAGVEVALDDLQSLMRGLEGARRLTHSFRFRTGASQLDPQSLGNIDRLARDIEAGLYDGRELIFVGFSDGDGPAAGNRQISLRRAQEVERLLREAAHSPASSRLKIGVQAYGETLPLACDDTEWGKQANRRVELWVR